MFELLKLDCMQGSTWHFFPLLCLLLSDVLVKMPYTVVVDVIMQSIGILRAESPHVPVFVSSSLHFRFRALIISTLVQFVQFIPSSLSFLFFLCTEVRTCTLCTCNAGLSKLETALDRRWSCSTWCGFS